MDEYKALGCYFERAQSRKHFTVLVQLDKTLEHQEVQKEEGINLVLSMWLTVRTWKPRAQS